MQRKEDEMFPNAHAPELLDAMDNEVAELMGEDDAGFFKFIKEVRRLKDVKPKPDPPVITCAFQHGKPPKARKCSEPVVPLSHYCFNHILLVSIEKII